MEFYGDDDDVLEYVSDKKYAGKRFKFELKGNDKNNQLIILGINPSKAQGVTRNYTSSYLKTLKVETDNTIKRILKFSAIKNFDGFLMLNVCAQRSSKTDSLPQIKDEKLHEENKKKIKTYLMGRKNISVLLAFGDAIKKQVYFMNNLKEIVEILREHNPTYYHLGTFTDNKNPRHPLPRNPNTLPLDSPLNPFLKSDSKWGFLFN